MPTLVLFATLVIGLQAAEPRTKAATPVDAKTPEQAFRTFLVAMITHDEATLRAVTLPTKDFAWLLRGETVPKDQAEEVKAQVASQPIRRLKPGDTFPLPGKRDYVVPPEEVTENRALLVPLGAPVPTRCRKVDGLWRIDAVPIVAARKAAAARKGASKTAKDKKTDSP